MGIVTYQLEVLELEVEQVLHIGVDNHLGQWARLTGKLELGLLNVVEIQVGIASGVDKVACLIACYLCHHLQQQSIAGNIKRHPQESVGRTLVELQ